MNRTGDNSINFMEWNYLIYGFMNTLCWKVFQKTLKKIEFIHIGIQNHSFESVPPLFIWRFFFENGQANGFRKFLWIVSKLGDPVYFHTGFVKAKRFSHYCTRIAKLSLYSLTLHNLLRLRFFFIMAM